MGLMKYWQRMVFIPLIFMVGACSTSKEYASVIEKKMESVRYEEREPITTLALVQKEKVGDVDVVIKSNGSQIPPQDVEAAAGDDVKVDVSHGFN